MGAHKAPRPWPTKPRHRDHPPAISGAWCAVSPLAETACPLPHRQALPHPAPQTHRGRSFRLSPRYRLFGLARFSLAYFPPATVQIPGFAGHASVTEAPFSRPAIIQRLLAYFGSLIKTFFLHLAFRPKPASTHRYAISAQPYDPPPKAPPSCASYKDVSRSKATPTPARAEFAVLPPGHAAPARSSQTPHPSARSPPRSAPPVSTGVPHPRFHSPLPPESPASAPGAVAAPSPVAASPAESRRPPPAFPRSTSAAPARRHPASPSQKHRQRIIRPFQDGALG